MGNLTTALTIIACLTGVFILASISITHINPTSQRFFNCEGTIIGDLEVSNCTSGGYIIADVDPITGLPQAESSVNVQTGNIFTDLFTASKNWLLDSLGLKYLINILSAPKQILQAIGAPPEVSFVLGSMWWVGVFFLLVNWLLWGRD